MSVAAGCVCNAYFHPTSSIGRYMLFGARVLLWGVLKCVFSPDIQYKLIYLICSLGLSLFLYNVYYYPTSGISRYMSFAGRDLLRCVSSMCNFIRHPLWLNSCLLKCWSCFRVLEKYVFFFTRHPILDHNISSSGLAPGCLYNLYFHPTSSISPFYVICSTIFALGVFAMCIFPRHLVAVD